METSFLNRVIRWDPASDRAELEAESVEIWDWRRYLQFLLAGAKLLNAEDTTLYRSVTMRVNFMSLDRPDLSFAAGSLARWMESPTAKDLEELERVGRYLRERPVGAIVFEPQTFPGVLEVFCDADHAGDLGTRKSQSGMAVLPSYRK